MHARRRRIAADIDVPDEDAGRPTAVSGRQIRGFQPVEPVQVVTQVTARTEIIDQIRKGDADYGQFMNPLAAGAMVNAVANRAMVADRTVRVDVSLTAQAQRGSSSWTYAAPPLRAGATFVLRTPRYELQGLVVQVTPAWTPAGAGSPPAEWSIATMTARRRNQHLTVHEVVSCRARALAWLSSMASFIARSRGHRQASPGYAAATLA